MKKKLLHIVLYLVHGGLEKMVYDFSRELNSGDYEVSVAALEKGGTIGDQLQQAGIPVYILGKKPGKFDFRLLVKLVKLIRKLQIQIIHSHSSCIMYAALAGKLAGVSIIVHTEHGRYFPDRFGKIMEDRIFCRLITNYVCVSRDLEEYMQSVVKVPSEKLITIINGINTSQYFQYAKEEALKLRKKHNIPPDALVIGTVCRLIPPKNVSFLIDWLREHHNLYEKFFLAIVGDGPQLGELVEMGKEVPGAKIKFFGARNDVADMLNLFDVFSLVSTTEGTSLTILEAMSTALPVVVSNVGGNKDLIVQGETGYLFECNNHNAFGECVKKIVNNPAKAKEMGARARRSVEKSFNFKKVINKYCELYN